MSDVSRYLCFNLGKEEFAIPLLSVKEVIGVPETTPIPQSQNYFTGIMNLRGQVISIMDLRIKLGIKAIVSEETSVVILDLGESFLGIMVDQVNSVQLINKDEISPKPAVDAGKSHDYIHGIYRKQDKLILLIDIAKALSVGDRTALAKKEAKAA